jgi:hypothetical protein
MAICESTGELSLDSLAEEGIGGGLTREERVDRVRGAGRPPHPQYAGTQIPSPLKTREKEVDLQSTCILYLWTVTWGGGGRSKVLPI